MTRTTTPASLGSGGPDTDFRTISRLPAPSAADPALDRLEQSSRSPPRSGSADQETLALSHAASMARTAPFLGAPSAAVSYERSPERYSAITPSASIEVPIFDQH